MMRDDVAERLDRALRKLGVGDRHLLENDLSERCIASRLAMYLQEEFREHDVDVEYNRAGDIAKRIRMPADCTKRVNRDGEALAVPDVIVHKRGRDGPNVLVLEMKKTSNPSPRNCDHERVKAFREQLGYEFAALIECETRAGHEFSVTVSEWHGD